MPRRIIAHGVFYVLKKLIYKDQTGQKECVLIYLSISRVEEVIDHVM